VQTHTLGEVGILGTVLLNVSWETILTIFIEIGSYLTDRDNTIQYSFITAWQNASLQMEIKVDNGKTKEKKTQ